MKLNSNSMHLLKETALLFLIYLFTSGLLSAQTNFNVSPEGTGNSSLLGAKNSIRNLTGSMSGDITVTLADGIYYLDEAIAFDETDGGNGDYNVIYKAADGANPVISGGVAVTGWEQDAVNTNLYKVQLVGIPHVRNIYVNNKRATRARGSKVSGASLYAPSGIKEGIIFSKSVIDHYPNTGIEINYTERWRDLYFLVDTIEDGQNVSGVDNDKYLVRIKNFNWNYTIGTPQLSPGAGSPMDKFYFENTLSVLDEPGEWCYDNKSKYLYYYPKPTEDMETVEVIVPKIDTLISIKSKDAFSKVQNIVFEGIKFAHNGWTWPSENGICVLNGTTIATDDYAVGTDEPVNKKFIIPGAIILDGAQNITFTKSLFTHIGSTALNLTNNTEEIYISRNSFVGISASAISVGSWKHTTIEQSAGEGPVTKTYISNNHVEDCGTEFGSSIAIDGFYTSEMEVSHNEVYKSAYSGIKIGWGWGVFPSPLANNKITDNIVVGVNQKANDGGSIYCRGANSGFGLLIEGNYIDELSYPSPILDEGAIYADEGSSNITIKNNVVKSSREWFFYHRAGIVKVDSMCVSSALTNWGGIGIWATDVTLEQNNVWSIPNSIAQSIQDSAGIQVGMAPSVLKEDNIVLNKKSIASGYAGSGLEKENGNDGDGYSIWASGATPTGDSAWWQVDLSGEYKLDRIELVARQDLDSPHTRKNFEVRGSNSYDFSTYTILGEKDNIAFEHLGTWIHEVTDTGCYRYLRIIQTIEASTFNFSEFRAYGELVNKVNTTNIVLNKTATASGVDNSYAIENGNDNSTSTMWESGTVSAGNHAWWQVDLSANYKITMLELVARQDFDSPHARKNFQVRGSNSSNFSTYTTLASLGDIAFDDKGTWTVDVNDTNDYRYLRIVQTVPETTFNFAEFRAYGDFVLGGSSSNIALNKGVIASDLDSDYTNEYGNDGSTSTMWASGLPSGSNAWWQVDLYGWYNITAVEMVARQDMDSPHARKNFEVRASKTNDFANYEVLASQGSAAFADKGTWSMNVQDSDEYRYLRVLQNIEGNTFNFAEFNAYGTYVDSLSNIALNKGAVASGVASTYSTDYANDNSISTMWASGIVASGENAWWQVDLNGYYQITDIALVARQDMDNPHARKNFEVRASKTSDFANYTVIASQGNSAFEHKGTWIGYVNDENSYRYLRVVQTLTATTFNFSEFKAHGTLIDSISTVNVALNKEVTVSGVVSPYTAENGNDNSISTMWASGTVASGDSAWWQVDLNGYYQITDIALVARQDMDSPHARKNFEIRASNNKDFTNYTVLANQGNTAFAHLGTWEAGVSSEVDFRYLRVVKTEAATTFNFSEFRAYGTLTAQVENPNIALKQATTASGVVSPYTIDNGNDNSTSTMWASGAVASGDTAWWQVDLNAFYKITDVELVARQDMDSPHARKNFEIRASNSKDFLSYTVLASQGNSSFAHLGTWSAEVNSNIGFRYLRVMKTDAATTFNFSEFRAYGEFVGAVNADNIAANKNCSAYAYANSTVHYDNGNDDCEFTLWSSGAVVTGDSAWWQVDLNGYYRIDNVQLVARKDVDSPASRRNFEIQGANVSDFTSYEVLASRGNSSFDHKGIWSSIVQDTRAYRFLRIKLNVEATVFNFAELKAFGELQSAVSLVNIALNKTSSAISSGAADQSSNKGNDDSTLSLWSSYLVASTSYAWWQVDLTEGYYINRLELASRQDMDTPEARKNFEIRASNSSDFSSYTVLASQGDEEFSNMRTWWVEVSNTTKYQYLRIVQSTPGTVFNFSEFRAFGSTTELKSGSLLKQENNILKATGPSVFPNPVRDMLNISFADSQLEEESDIEVLILNMQGRTLKKKNINGVFLMENYSINLSELNSGVYVLIIRTKRMSYSTKILKTDSR